MPDWLTYTPSDFLLFSPRTYYRLIERYNASLRPLPLVTTAPGLVLAGLASAGTERAGRTATAIAGAAWAWVGWAFLWSRYATINWAATWFAGLFWLEAALLLWLGVARGRVRPAVCRSPASIAGLALLAVGVALYPAIAPLAGRGAAQAETFGMTPDPTAIATLGLVVLAEGAPRGRLLAVPVLWCLITGVTLWTMESPEAWVPLAGALVAVAAVLASRSR